MHTSVANKRATTPTSDGPRELAVIRMDMKYSKKTVQVNIVKYSTAQYSAQLTLLKLAMIIVKIDMAAQHSKQNRSAVLVDQCQVLRPSTKLRTTITLYLHYKPSISAHVNSSPSQPFSPLSPSRVKLRVALCVTAGSSVMCLWVGCPVSGTSISRAPVSTANPTVL